MRLHPLIAHVAGAYCGPAAGATDLEDRVVSLEGLDRFVRSKGDTLFREEEVYDSELQPGVLLCDALFDPQHPCISSDARKILIDILNRSRGIVIEDRAGNRPLANLGLWPSGVCFLATADDWYQFRRNSLHLCDVTTESFCQQARQIFPNLELSKAFPNCLDTLEGGFQRFMPVVVKAFAALNDGLRLAIGKHAIVDGLKRFSATSGFQTTMEGNADRNPALTFVFEGEGGATKRVCAPHMKLASSGMDGDSKHYSNRIYFSPYQDGAASNRIHVGHAGRHL